MRVGWESMRPPHSDGGKDVAQLQTDFDFDSKIDLAQIDPAAFEMLCAKVLAK